MEDLRVTKAIKGIRLEGVLSELEPEEGFQGQSFTEYLILTLDFVWNSALRSATKS